MHALIGLIVLVAFVTAVAGVHAVVFVGMTVKETCKYVKDKVCEKMKI